MTKKLFNHILATSLIFGSLYLPAHAESVSKTPPAKAVVQIKKSPEANFVDGSNCLRLGNITCAKLASANIPSTSPYAKLLQGGIALYEKQTDKALLLLMPLQTEESLTSPAKISLHEYLASAFESLDDAQQAIQHLIQAETFASASGMTNPATKNIQSYNDAANEKIWNLLKKLEQSELIELRGNNTDNIFQGWVDLRLAAKNQDFNSSMASWSSLYPDHPAQAFARKISSDNAPKPSAQAKLSSDSSIALIVSLTDATDSARAEAFKLGLESALTRNGLSNKVKLYDEPQGSNESYALATSDGSTYFIAPNFGDAFAENRFDLKDTGNILRIGLPLADEAGQIVNFAINHAMQRITIVTADNKTGESMLKNFTKAWQARFGAETESNLTIITLPADIASAESNLLELKTQIASKNPDMILLALTAPEARLVRPRLDISIPAIAFSSINEPTTGTSTQALNAVRFADMPFVIAGRNDETYRDYNAAAASLNSSDLLRWFALGADSLQLLITNEQQIDEISINGLSGMISINQNGILKHQLTPARFTYNGVEQER